MRNLVVLLTLLITFQCYSSKAANTKPKPEFPDIKKELLKKDSVLRKLQMQIDSIKNQIKNNSDNSTINGQIDSTINEKFISHAANNHSPFSFDYNFSIVSILTSILVFFLLFYFLKGYQSVVLDDKLNDLRIKITRETQQRARPDQNVSNYEIIQLREEINKLRSEIEKLKNSNSSKNIPLEIEKPKENYQTISDEQQFIGRSPIETFFLSTPNADGSFNESSASQFFRDGASIYKFTKISNNRATFKLDEREASVKLALQYPDKNIDPVCDAVNAFNSKANRIVTIESGTAELLNDKWIVSRTQKAKIKYES
jgi:hypothetical protein